MLRAIVLAIGVIGAAAAVTAQAGVLPRAQLAAGLKTAGCELPIEQSITAVTEASLGGGLSLVEVPCWAAAYNFGSILFVVDARAPAKARLLSLRTWSGGALSETYDLTLPQFDPSTRVLRSYHKGRGVGDCGESGQWLWTGSRFKLTGYWNKPDCDGKVFTRAAKWRVYPPRKP